MLCFPERVFFIYRKLNKKISEMLQTNRLSMLPIVLLSLQGSGDTLEGWWLWEKECLNTDVGQTPAVPITSERRPCSFVSYNCGLFRTSYEALLPP